MKSLARGARYRYLVAALLLATPALHQVSAAPPAAAAAGAGSAVVLEIDGAIGPATSRYVVHGLEAAPRDGARLVVLEMDTPGGLDSAMRDIIRAILASRVPTTAAQAPTRPARARANRPRAAQRRASRCRAAPWSARS